MAESEADHRRRLERWLVIGGMIRSYIGVFAALAIVLFAIYIGGRLVLQGHDVAGASIATAGVAGLLGTFIYGTQVLRKEKQ